MIPQLPSSYVHGADGPCVVIPGRIAALLVQRGLSELRLAMRGMDAEADAALEAIVMTAAAWRRRHGIGSDHGLELEERDILGSDLPLTTADAAELLVMGPRGVRRAISTGRLPAHRVGDVWLIKREDVEQFRSTRANGVSK